MNEEIWKPIVGYEGLYDVSNHGRVRSYYKSTRCKNPPYVLSPGNTRGYRNVLLCKDTVKFNELVHRLVAEAFIGAPPTSDHQINHKDYDKARNVPENLEWVTQTENNQYSAPLVRRLLGEANPCSKLSEDDVREIRSRYAAGGITQQKLADEFGISNPSCNFIIRRLKWKHVE